MNDGRNLVDRYHDRYEAYQADTFSLSCKIAARWINNFFREEKIRKFPDDISENPDILLKFLYKLTNRKEFDGTYEFEIDHGTK